MRRRRDHRPRVAAAVAFGLVILATSSCGSERKPAAAPTADGGLRVEASFYALAWVAQRVGGDHVSVANLTPPGAEPHDLELTPGHIAAVQDADVVAYLSDFQPAVDDAVAGRDAVVFDARRLARLHRAGPHDGTGTRSGSAAVRKSGHHGEGAVDPHFWLDPTRLADVATALAGTFGRADPDHAEVYDANASTLGADLGALDHDFRVGLARCDRRKLVTGHASFGYLADSYGFDQVGVTGISPNADPSPSDLAAVADFAREHQVRTIYVEPLVDPGVAEVVADEVDGETAVLDPIEAITERSAGHDYLEVMRSNLATLRRGQGCR